ncbi:TetR/AcrR family transcriptional regulator [Kordiimonas laminariae]|uniref:TetR/AcrR family transcriptional regulator n=1 Tax=Kordiimonas laminariae TaxID=2917717 RepID=UPI001FF4CD94|nr:TetR/AcrR family transcriptional regulator [Kordiimonas laminariae]MCK0069321.1 TetR/AcrR family transcriptional regulator [Kordiimonas laminariae]
MPRIAKLNKTEMAARLSNVFQENGYEGASMAMLAGAAELSKASLYHHFPNGKKDMADKVLAHAGARLQKYVLAPLNGKDTPEKRLANSFEGVAQYYEGDVPFCLMNSLLVGEGKALFQQQINTAVGMWQAGLERAYLEMGLATEEAERKARSRLVAIQGSLVLCRVENSRAPLEECLQAFK